jgi:hypothetical protein
VTIHRLGPDGDAAESYTVDLGQVLVTIDDLHALLERLQKGPPVKPNDSGCVTRTDHDLKIEFNGGYCTESNDLRRLSDGEVARIWVTSPTVQVILGPTQAIAVGDQETAEDIYRRWARARQTRRRPRLTNEDASPKAQTIGPTVLGLVGLLVIAVLVVTNFHPTLAPMLHLNSALDKIAAAFFALTGVISSAYMIRLILYGSTSYAIIEPLTLAEYRNRQANNKYPRLSYILGGAALVVTTILSVLVALLKP